MNYDLFVDDDDHMEVDVDPDLVTPSLAPGAVAVDKWLLQEGGQYEEQYQVHHHCLVQSTLTPGCLDFMLWKTASSRILKQREKHLIGCILSITQSSIQNRFSV